ncbi:hypothetical protein NODU109028_13190 [Nocardioides dubius]|uniref:Uncharacterized protein n=1 Tax=Nocardioides dubius TaxID=317019 RepID=A0ABN1U3J4_9ACTN
MDTTPPVSPFPASDRPSPPPRKGRSTRWWVAISLVALSPLLAIGGFAGWLMISGTPLIDEWQCSDGEAPYVYPEGGSACAKEGSQLPKGASWDPFGNRPLSCHDRWGWVEVEPVRPDPDDPRTDCVRKGEPIPEGWHAVG